MIPSLKYISQKFFSKEELGMLKMLYKPWYDILLKHDIRPKSENMTV